MNPLNYEKNLLSCSAWARRAVCARAHRPPAGLLPGESITLSPYLYHSFWGTGSRVLVGEVSAVNDDQEDNRFHQPLGRFPDIVEDEPPLYLLVNDYADYYRPWHTPPLSHRTAGRAQRTSPVALCRGIMGSEGYPDG